MIKNNQNDKLYIGQTTWPLNKRWSSHKKCAKMILNSINGVPLNEQYKGISNSALYNAMATIGIENFHISVVEETIDDLLNSVEIRYIKEFNCRIPDGYNMTTGGGSRYHHSATSIEKMKQIKKENANNNRNQVLHDMPLYVCYEKKLQAIIVQKHPLCAFKGFYIRKYVTLEAAKAAASAFIEELEKSGKPHVKERKLKNSPYKGVYEIPANSGVYYVTKQVNKKPYRKNFSSGTPDENKKNAVDYAISLSNNKTQQH